MGGPAPFDLRSALDQMDSYGQLWTVMDSYGQLWTVMGRWSDIGMLDVLDVV